MRVRYMSLVRTSASHRVAIIATARSGREQMVVGEGLTPRQAHEAAEKKLDTISAEWWTE